MKKLTLQVSDLTFKKLQQQKDDDGYSNKSWGEWLSWKARSVELDKTDVGRLTRKYLLSVWCKNFARNLPRILEGDSITSLVPENPESVPKGAAVVIGAGPSIHKHKHLELLADAIKAEKFKGIVCVSDKMLKPCLELGIAPYIAVSVDGSPLIAKWYEDQENEIRNLKHKIHACLNVTVHPTVADACRKSGFYINWFNPMMDAEQDLDSFTRMQKLLTATDKQPNGVPAVSCGGNAGTATWVLTQTLLRRSPIALIGFDMGYPEGTNLENTPYFSSFMDMTGDEGVATQMYSEIYHPIFKTKAYIDRVFKSYRETFLSLLTKVPPWSQTVNCTEGGTLFGQGLSCMSFKTFLDNVSEE